MKKTYLFLCVFVLLISNAFAQQRPIPRNTNPDKEKEKYAARVEEEKQKYLNDFIVTLDVDDFQKEIILQTMDSYFDEIGKINQLGLKSFERQEHIDRLDASHFKDLKLLVKEDDMAKIMDALKGKWDRKEEKKDKKKKKKKKKNRKDKS